MNTDELCRIMKLDNDFLKEKFDDIDGKIDFMIEFCQTLQAEKLQLISKVEYLETELDKKKKTEDLNDDQQVIVQSKIDGLLKKLDSFSESYPDNRYQSDY
jgi:uncharacterized coiled-coil DUF342 family protein